MAMSLDHSCDMPRTVDSDHQELFEDIPAPCWTSCRSFTTDPIGPYPQASLVAPRRLEGPSIRPGFDVIASTTSLPIAKMAEPMDLSSWRDFVHPVTGEHYRLSSRKASKANIRDDSRRFIPASRATL